MENKEFKIIVTALVPKAVEHIGKSGGFVRLMEILGRINKIHRTKIILVASNENLSRHFSENGIEAEVKLMKPYLKFRNLRGLTFKAFFLVLKFLFFYPKKNFIKTGKAVFYCSSDLFWDTIPAYFCRKRYRNTRWTQEIYHICTHWRKRNGNFWPNFFGYYFQKISLALIKRKADLIFALSDSLKEELIRRGFKKEKIFVSYNGIDPEYFEKLTSSGICYEGIFLGRLNYSKGIYDLVKIWKKVCDKLPKAKLAVIGGGDEKTKRNLMEKIEESDLKNNIKILGYLDDKEAYSLLKSSKVFLFPSHEEGWGIVINEAMACGVPVVSWDLPVYQSIFEDYTLKIKENDIEKFAGEVITLLENESSKKELGEKGKEYVKRYSWDRVAENEYGLLNSLF